MTGRGRTPTPPPCIAELQVVQPCALGLQTLITSLNASEDEAPHPTNYSLPETNRASATRLSFAIQPISDRLFQRQVALYGRLLLNEPWEEGMYGGICLASRCRQETD